MSRGAGLVTDGLYGPASHSAVRSAQTDLGLPVDGVVTQELLDALRPSPTTPVPPVDPAGFVVASPGTVNVNGRETSIVRRCTTEREEFSDNAFVST